MPRPLMQVVLVAALLAVADGRTPVTGTIAAGAWCSSLPMLAVRRVTDDTYHGVVWGTMAAQRRILPRDRGMIDQIGSRAEVLKRLETPGANAPTLAPAAPPAGAFLVHHRKPAVNVRSSAGTTQLMARAGRIKIASTRPIARNMPRGNSLPGCRSSET